VSTARRFRITRDVIVASGADAATYLHSQLSNDIVSLEPGASCHSFLLQPTGKIVSLVRVTRTAPEAFEIDTDEGAGAATLERLLRFKIRVKCDLVAAPRVMWALRGLDDEMAERALRIPGARRAWRPDSGAVDVPADHGVDGEDGVDGEVAAAVHSLVPDAGDEREYEALRVRSGWPVTDAELTAESMVAETDIVDVAVSFTKGCYPGQELVERMDSRGASAPRSFVVLRSNGRVAGDEYVINGVTVGRVTSSAGDTAIVSVLRAHLPLVESIRVDDRSGRPGSKPGE
jgi:folate-binding protein YgfZ